MEKEAQDKHGSRATNSKQNRHIKKNDDDDDDDDDDADEARPYFQLDFSFFKAFRQ